MTWQYIAYIAKNRDLVLFHTKILRKRMLEFEGGGHSTGRVTELLAKKISVGESRRGGRG